MEQLDFLVKGSTPDPYEITFIKDGDSLTAICTCPAGTFGNLCKHRVAILDGDAAAIVSNNADKAPLIQEWLVGTDVESALKEMRAADWPAESAKDSLAAAKRKLARAMNS
jgi:uncharacterized Zn finger protein